MNAAVFGKRREPHTIIIARGDHLRHFTIRPWVLALGFAVLAAVAVGYLLATSYLMLRDDVLNAAIARQARMQYAYEDRIAALRSQVDRITSYRLLDQQVMESKVADLISRQSVIAKRAGRLAPLLDKVEESGVTAASLGLTPSSVPVPAASAPDADGRTIFRPQESAGADPAEKFAVAGATSQVAAKTPYVALSHLGDSLDKLEINQVDQVGALADSVRRLREKLVADATGVGLDIDDPGDNTNATGGPFIPMSSAGDADPFDLGIEDLNRELKALDTVRGAVRAYPIANPGKGRRVSSNFGKRQDPMLDRTAFHPGIDFAVPLGTPIKAAGAGKVVRAGRNGGYGNMVEIRHSNGLTSRYAHLSKILVSTGDRVTSDTVIGQSGSTGRSTGPHLHFEVREHGKAVDPMTYIRAGRRLTEYL